VRGDALPTYDRPPQIANPGHALAIKSATSNGFAAAALRRAVRLGGRTFRSDKKHSRAARSSAQIFSQQVLQSQCSKGSAQFWEQVQVDALLIHGRSPQIADPARALVVESATSNGFAPAALRRAVR